MRPSTLLSAFLAVSITFYGCATTSKLSITTTDPAAEIYLDGQLAGTGAVSLPVGSPQVELKVNLADYDPYESILVRDQRTSLIKKTPLGGVLMTAPERHPLAWDLCGSAVPMVKTGTGITRSRT